MPNAKQDWRRIVNQCECQKQLDPENNCLATSAVMLALDLQWLGVVAKAMYQQGIGH